jgi:hypothetical protein
VESRRITHDESLVCQLGIDDREDLMTLGVQRFASPFFGERQPNLLCQRPEATVFSFRDRE